MEPPERPESNIRKLLEQHRVRVDAALTTLQKHAPAVLAATRKSLAMMEQRRDLFVGRLGMLKYEQLLKQVRGAVEFWERLAGGGVADCIELNTVVFSETLKAKLSASGALSTKQRAQRHQITEVATRVTLESVQAWRQKRTS